MRDFIIQDPVAVQVMLLPGGRHLLSLSGPGSVEKGGLCSRR
jgi:hypothetical protein